MSDLLMRRTAIFSPCGLYRLNLTRVWGDGPLLFFAMLQASTAGPEVDDPTIRRCMSFARRERFSGIDVVNMYGLISPYTETLKTADDPFGPGNYVEHVRVLKTAAERSIPVVCAWGAHPLAAEPAQAFVQHAAYHRARLVCLGKTARGAPRHPLYVKGDQPFEAFP